MTPRAEARLAGYAYLSYIVFAMSSALVSAKTMAGADTARKLATLASMLPTARVTVVLDLLQMVCAIVLAVTLYRLSRGVDATLALLALCFRLGEGLLGALPLLDKLELIQLATDPTMHCADNAGCLAVARAALNRPDNEFSAFCFVVGGFLFAWLLLRGRLIPRWLAWTGVLTIAVQVICVPLSMATILPESVVNELWFPILLYEVPLGIWLIAKGVREPAMPFQAVGLP